MVLQNIIGQPVAVSILERGLKKGTLAHAYLLHGDRGLGKETTAHAVARALSNEGTSAQLRVIEPNPTIKIDQIRQIREQSSYAQDGYLVWLLKDVDRMTLQAANSFLKILEEPSAGVYFFLTTTNMHGLLSTIVSRCQVVPFRAISENLIIDFLSAAKGIEINDPRLELVARMSRGSIGRALEYWDGPVLEHRENVLKTLAKIPKLTFPEILGLSQAWDEDRNQVLLDLQFMLEWCRDVAAVKSQADIPLYNPDFRSELNDFSTIYSYGCLLEIAHHISEMIPAVQSNARPRFVLGYLLLIMKKGAQS